MRRASLAVVKSAIDDECFEREREVERERKQRSFMGRRYGVWETRERERGKGKAGRKESSEEVSLRFLESKEGNNYWRKGRSSKERKNPIRFRRHG